jgi:uncharacterized protein YicC (UPF0701 family)
MAASKKTSSLTEEQKKLEANVKGYQFKELTDKFIEMKEEFGAKLDTIIAETRGVATVSQVEAKIKEAKKEITDDMDKLERQLHAEMDARDKAYMISMLL